MNNPPASSAGFLLPKDRKDQRHRENVESARGDTRPGRAGFTGIGKGQHKWLRKEGAVVCAISVPGIFC